jgi:5,6-dimethylbenzimidazole synthase
MVKAEAAALAFSDAERDAIYRVIAERRDVRRGFLPQPLPDELLHRLLAAAHRAPSVGLMQPTRFVVIRDHSVRHAVHEIFHDANQDASARYADAQRDQYDGMKLEGLLEAPQHLCILCDTESNRGHGLGRQTMPEMALYSTVCAVQNLWLAARSEGVGVGWVSILDPERLRRLLRIPQQLQFVAYLCIGYVDAFAPSPDLERLGWEKRVELESAISYDGFRGED